MCSIVGTFDTAKLKELAALNSYRGEHSHSVSFYSIAEQKLVSVQKGMGPLPVDKISIPNGFYAICHQQAPTTEAKDLSSVHPAEFDGHYLWHNGIIKQKEIESMKNRLKLLSSIKADVDTNWDTKLLLQLLVAHPSYLNDIDGTFACVYVEGWGTDMDYLKIFRNEISPLFLDDKYNISSTKFEGSRILEPGVIWNFEPGVAVTDSGIHFTTAENPYYFG